MGPKEYLSLAITFVGIIAAFFVHKVATNHGKSSFDKIVYLILLTILLWSITQICEKQLFDNKKTELLENYKFENLISGVWIESYFDSGNVSRYALIRINFDLNLTKINFNGIAYDDSGNVIAHFNSLVTYAERASHKLYYMYEGFVMDKPLPGKGYGEVNFYPKIGSDSLTFASGYIRDDFTKYIPVQFFITILSKEYCLSLWGKGIPEFNEDAGEFIRLYHKKKSKMK